MDGNGQRDGRGVSSGPAAGDDLSRRLERLGADLDAREQRSRTEAAPKQRSNDASAIGMAFRLSAEFVAGVVAGAGLGWVIDRVTGSGPWGLIVCLLLGFCAGMMNLLRATGALKPARSRHGR